MHCKRKRQSHIDLTKKAMTVHATKRLFWEHAKKERGSASSSESESETFELDAVTHNQLVGMKLAACRRPTALRMAFVVSPYGAATHFSGYIEYC